MVDRNRPLPADFAEVARAGASISEMRARYGAGTFVVNRWIAQIGGKPRAKRVLLPRSIPEDFPIHAATETVDQLMKRYGCGTVAIARWRREALAAGTLTRSARDLKPLPDDFAAAAANLTDRDVLERYAISKPTLRKWCAKAGVVLRKAPRIPPPNLGGMGRPKAAPFAAHRDHSRAGQAADYLRRYGPVIRCKADGTFDPKGDHWRRGAAILTADEVIARARRNGWNPDAWKDLAA